MQFASPKQHREATLFKMFWNTVNQPHMLGQKTWKQCRELNVRGWAMKWEKRGGWDHCSRVGRWGTSLSPSVAPTI